MRKRNKPKSVKAETAPAKHTDASYQSEVTDSSTLQTVPTHSEHSEAKGSWLRQRLQEAQMVQAQIIECERVLILEHGFETEEYFASFPPERFTLQYLVDIGITTASSANSLIFLHKTMHEELFHNTKSSFVASIAAETPSRRKQYNSNTIILPDTSTDRDTSWLAVRLKELKMAETHIKKCEKALIEDHGFTTEEAFAKFPHENVTLFYLHRIGIKAIGTAFVVECLHQRLHEHYSIQPSNDTSSEQEPANFGDHINAAADHAHAAVHAAFRFIRKLFPGENPNKSGMMQQHYHCGECPITAVRELFDATNVLPNTSPRLMLQGSFQGTDPISGTVYSHSCVIKNSASDSRAQPSTKDIISLRREYKMFSDIQSEVKKIGRNAWTGCVRCYYAHPKMHYIVLENHGTDLRALLNASLSRPDIVLDGIVPAVKALHSLGVMHGNIKPHNILYRFNTIGECEVKLCDLDNAYRVGETCDSTNMGTKYFRAPELVHAAEKGNSISASCAIDMFSLGLVIWQVLHHTTVPALNFDKENDDFLTKLYSNDDALISHLSMPFPYQEPLSDLFCTDPLKRMSIVDLHNEIVKLSTSNAHMQLLKANQEIERLHRDISSKLDDLKQGQVQLGQQVGRVLDGNAELRAMVETVIAGTHSIPTLAIMLPEVAKSWHDTLNPLRLARNQYRLFFLCSHTNRIAPCGPTQKGYLISVTKQWVQDAAPVLRVGLVLVKLALLATGLPLPIPDLCTTLRDSEMHVKYIDAALQIVAHPPEDSSTNTEISLDRTLDSVEKYEVENLQEDQESSHIGLEEGSRKAYETIKTVLEDSGVNIPLTCGLRQVTHKGKTAWVLDDDAVEKAWAESISVAEAAAICTASIPKGVAPVEPVSILPQANGSSGRSGEATTSTPLPDNKGIGAEVNHIPEVPTAEPIPPEHWCWNWN